MEAEYRVVSKREGGDIMKMRIKKPDLEIEMEGNPEELDFFLSLEETMIITPKRLDTLRTIKRLRNEGVYVSTAAVAKALDTPANNLLNIFGKLKEYRLIEETRDRGWQLTNQGEDLLRKVKERIY